MRRHQAVAGYFYPSDKKELLDFFRSNELSAEKTDACAVIVPHAGYIYSGATAFKTLSKVNIPDTVILIGPNHTGAGAAISVYPEGQWQTPLGDVSTDDGIISGLTASPLFTRDDRAHQREHSLEVIVPMLRYFNPEVKIVCITMKFMDITLVHDAAETLFSVLDGKKCLIVVSSDFNHFENAEITEKKDGIAIDSLIKMDENLLFQRVIDYNISMCGFIPACVGLICCKKAGASVPELVEHTHSGYVSGDHDRVVGYAGLIFKK
ncbi:MAG: AmmeMemoRadiSam system protein B [Deferribacterales bacterium]